MLLKSVTNNDKFFRNFFKQIVEKQVSVNVELNSQNTEGDTIHSYGDGNYSRESSCNFTSLFKGTVSVILSDPLCKLLYIAGHYL